MFCNFYKAPAKSFFELNLKSSILRKCKGIFMDNNLIIAIYAFVFLFGLMIGSFLNVLIIRIPLGEGFVKGRSHCMHCDKVLNWYELIPLFSWLILHGKCSVCKGKISAQYPIIELSNALLWVIVFAKFGMTIDTILACLLTSTLLVLSVIDGKTREIPTQTTVFIGILGVIKLITNISDWKFHILGSLVISTFLLLLLVLSKGRAMGGGDVKLMAGVGLFLGLAPTIFAFFLACIIGSIVHLLKMAIIKAKNDLAMGPYLAVGTFISMIWGEDVIAWYLNLLGI